MRSVSTLVSGGPPARSAQSPAATRIADYAVMVLAVVLGGGSIALLAWSAPSWLVPMDLSPTAALWWNALLSLIFFAQHSVLVRRSVRARLAALIPPRYDGAFYAITSGVALALVAVLYQRIEAPPLFALDGIPQAIVTLAAVFALACLTWGILALRTFDPFGLRPIQEHLRHGQAASSPVTPAPQGLVVRGPYRFVRHPLYSAIIVLLWAAPRMTLERLELAVLWTAWICVGAALEERDLLIEFGEPYRQYRRRVPMLIPWRAPAAAHPAP